MWDVERNSSQLYVVYVPHPFSNVHDVHHVHRRLIGDSTLALGFA